MFESRPQSSMKKIIIAIDGPAGSGKSTTARLVAETLGYIYIDTGAMYRAVTLAWIRSGKEADEKFAYEILSGCKIELRQSPNGQRTILNDEDVSSDIRLPEVTKLVSPVSAMGSVRKKMVDQQRRLGELGGVVMDGRDIGTVVFPKADLKIYLVASIEARTERRLKELKEKNVNVTIEELRRQITERDDYDSSRQISPLRKADDAIVVDTSNLTIEQQTQKILDLAKEIIDKI